MKFVTTWMNLDEPWGHCAKSNKSDRERQLPHDLTCKYNLKKKKKKAPNKQKQMKKPR